MRISLNFRWFTALISGLFKLWAKSLRYEIVGDWKSMIANNLLGQPMVIALWHGEIFPIAAYGYKISSNFVIVVSQSKDGEIIAQLLEKLGNSTVRGSSSRGGVKALLRAKRIMDRENRIGVFAVDGPRGPRHKAKDGILFLAQKADAQIIPIRATPQFKISFKSWDKFQLPMPFSKCTIVVGKPMAITSEKLDKEILKRERNRLETRLDSLSPHTQCGTY